MNLPIVLIKSDGATEPKSIITSIRKVSLDVDQEVLDESENKIGYKHRIITKYYEVDIIFYPVDSLDDLPNNILNYIEGVIIYFEAENRDFLKDLPKYAEFIKSHQIELGVLLCNELAEDAKDGVTFREAKQYCKQLDVMELERKLNEEEEYDVINDPIGYDELSSALKSCLWSNVTIKENVGPKNLLLNYLDEDDDDDIQDIDGNDVASKLDHKQPDGKLTEQELEEEIAGFEKLLTQVLSFRPNTETWSRNERLLYAEKFATVFDNLIDEDDDDEDDHHNITDEIK